MNRLGLLLAAVPLAAAGCTAAPETPAPAPDGQASASVSPSTAPSSAAPSAGCPDGTYVLTGFAGTGMSANRITATGNNARLTFTAGRYRLTADGSTPYEISVPDGETGELLLKGSIDGTYSGSGESTRYQVTDTSGRVTLTAAGETRSGGMSLASRTLAPQGAVPTTCVGEEMTITMPTAELSLRKA